MALPRGALDILGFVRDMTSIGERLIAAEVKNHARELVRVDTSRLRNTIRVDLLPTGPEVVSETPYAAAQEYGRPDLPNYGFTPYMRPAAMAATMAAGLISVFADAERIAEGRNRR